MQIILFYSDGMVCKDSGILLIRHLTTRGVEKHSEHGLGRALNASKNWTVHCSLWEHGLYIPIVQWCLSSPLVDTHKMDCSSEESPQSAFIYSILPMLLPGRARPSNLWLFHVGCKEEMTVAIGTWVDLRIQVTCCDDGWCSL